MKTRVSTAFAAAAFAALPLVPAIANPILTISASPYGLPAQSGAVNMIDLTNAPLGSVSGYVINPGANSVTLSTSTNGAVVQGSSTNSYAAPVTGGSVASPTYLTSPYLSSGGSPGGVTLSFAQSQSFLGLLWGSIGTADELDFYSKGTKIASETGQQVINASANYSSVSGAQGFNGSEYVLANLIGGTFDQVVMANTGQPSFEAGAFEYSTVNQSVPVPEPMSLALLGMGLMSVCGLRLVRKPI